MLQNNVWIYLKNDYWIIKHSTIEGFCESLIYNLENLIKLLYIPKNHPCQDRPGLVNINSDENLFYLFTVSDNKSSGSCNTIEFVFQIK